MPGRAARGYRERHLAKECFGSNRVSKERLQLPAATTTETNPKGRKTVIRKNAHYQKKPPTTPCATTAQHPKENHFSLDKLFQEWSSGHCFVRRTPSYHPLLYPAPRISLS